MKRMRHVSRCIAGLSLAVLLAACAKSPENPAPVPAPAAASVAAPAAASAAAPAVSTAPAPSTAPTAASIAAAANVPAITTAVSAASTAAPAAASDHGPEIAGSVAVAQGSVTDTAKDGSVRQLKDGDDVYPGDSFVLGDASYLDLDLEDTGRILLRPNTSFQITSYHFEPDAHDANGPTDANGQPLFKPQQPENAFFRLLKGGLHAVDGLIGHSTPQNYGVETPVATIGVRGTTFDVRYCGDDCGDEADASGKPDNGLYTSVSDGSVGIKNDSGETVTNAGHSGFVRSRMEKMQALSSPPKALRHMDLPDQLKARAQKNRAQIQVRRQQRRQQVLQRRQAAQKARAAGQPAATSPKTLQERRQQRQEEQRGAAQQPAADKAARQQQREQRRERREQMQTTAPKTAQPTAAGQAPAQGQEMTPRERRQQLRQGRQQQREQKQQAPAAQAPAKAAQPAADKEDKQGEGRCKGKRKKAREKDKGKCGGD